jgi:hypothetical protein
MSLPEKTANASGNLNEAMSPEDYLQPVAFVAKNLSDENRLRILLCAIMAKGPSPGLWKNSISRSLCRG